MTVQQAESIQVTKRVKPGITANWALFATSISLFVVGVLTSFNRLFGFFGDAINYAEFASPLPIATYFEIVFSVLLPILLVGSGLIGMLIRKPKIVFLLLSVILLIWYPVTLGFNIAFASLVLEYDVAAEQYFRSLFPMFFNFEAYPIAKFLFLFVFVLSLLSIVIKPREPRSSGAHAQSLGEQMVSGADPDTQEVPARNHSTSPMSPAVGGPSQLPMFALIASFFIPLAGIVMGHIALSQINRGQISSQNRSMAVVGLVLGYVFTALGILAAAILVSVVLSNPYFF